MNYLDEIGFDQSIINDLEETIPEKIKKLLIDNKKLVLTNINYLKDLGVSNYQEAFRIFYDTFLLDASTFKNIFEKYDPDDLKTKIENNVKVIELL